MVAATPASGRRVSFEVIDILTIFGGRIVDHRVVFDRLGLQQQLTG
jgi:predicted ester cyclase